MTDLVFPVFGPMAWIDVVVLIWILLALASAAYVTWDAFTQNPELTVMKWGWVLVTLYTGVLGAVLYVMSCKEPRPGTHERFITPLWKQGVGSAIHCVAGDATGIVVAATVTALIGFPMWLDLIVEYVAGFAFGLLIFQALSELPRSRTRTLIFGQTLALVVESDRGLDAMDRQARDTSLM